MLFKLQYNASMIIARLKTIFYLGIIFLIIYNLYLSSFSARHGELNFFSDVARDFLLLQELDEKKIVFIGPRSNTSGLFHGPLWTYINYPAYVIGQGNPVTVAWFWVTLASLFSLTSFFIARSLFGTFPALVYVLLLTIRLPPYINGIFHSEATIFFVPIFLFSIYKYIVSKKNIFLGLHLLSLAILIQLNIGVGFSLLTLSGLLIIWFIVKHKLWKQLLILLLLPVFLSNLIVFDLRHNLQMTHAMLASAQDKRLFSPLPSLIDNRIQNTVSLQLIRGKGIEPITLAIFIVLVVFTIMQIKSKKKERSLYFLFVFYYFGFMLTSFISRGVLLYHHIHLLIPFTALWLVSPLKSKFKIFFLPLVTIIYFTNYNDTSAYLASLKNSIGKTTNSWVSLSTVAAEVINRQKGKEFGYFVFSPDSFAYQPRYAMIYNFQSSNTKVFEYTKKPTTYLIAAPPPPNDPYMNHVWWRKNSVKISSDPIWSKSFPSGFTIEEFQLSPEEQKVPHDKSIELGIHFR